MGSARSLISPAAIRQASLPKSLRGFDEAATRKLLIDAAETVQTLMDENKKLKRSIDESKDRPALDPEDAAALGNVLLAAQRAGEEIVAHARATADQITAGAEEASEQLLQHAQRTAAEAEQERARLDEVRAEVEVERQRVIGEAQAEADRIAAEGHERLDAVRRDERALSQLIGDRRRQIADVLQSALDQISRLQDADGEEAQPELTTVLRARVADASPDPQE